MAKKFALVSPLYSFAVQDLMDKIIDQAEGEDIELIQSTPGGSVFSAWALAGFFKDREGKLTIKAFGDSSSMGFYNCLYADEVIALDVTQFKIHRADGYVENEDDRFRLNEINKNLRKAMESKLDIEKFEKITGVSISEIFDSENRIEVTLTAKQAKKVGLVNKIIPMNDTQIKAMNENFAAFSDFFEESQGSDSPDPQGSGDGTQGSKLKEDEDKQKENKTIVEPKTEKKMTQVEIKAQHPEIYAEIVNEGVTAERKRCKAFLAFKDIDMEASVKGIEEGTEMDVNIIAEMSAKKLTSGIKEEIKEDSPEEIAAQAEAKTKEQKEVEAAEKESFEAAGLKKSEEKS